MPPRKRKNNLVFYIWCTLIVFFAFEALFRNTNLDELRGFARTKLGEKLNDCLIKDEYLDHILLPNCRGQIKTRDFDVEFTTNSLGFNDQELSDKPPGIRRVLIIGDSFAEGWGVKRQDRFDQILSPGYQFINMGVRSYSPVLEQKLLEKYIDLVKPDVVVTMLDFSDLHDDYYYTRKPLLSSRFFETIYVQYKIRDLDKRKQIDRVNLTHDIALFAKAHDWEGYSEAWNLTRDNISKTKKYLSNKGISHKLAVVPRGVHIGETEWHNGRKALGIETDKVFNSPDIFRDSEIDLLSPLKEAEIKFKGNLYYSFDGHWTPEGHKVVSQVFQKLANNKEL